MPRPLRTVAALFALAVAAAVLPLAGSSADAAPNDAMYRSLSSFEPAGPQVRVSPDHYAATRVDTGLVRAALADAPAAGAATSTTISIPTPTGGLERFAVQRTQMMQAGLAAAHPEIRTWAGRSLDHPGTSVALDVTPMGFHASVLGPHGQGAWYVDPAYNRRGTSEHLSYYGADLPRPEKQFVEREAPGLAKVVARRQAAATAGEAVTQRVYRLALVSDPTYADYFGSENVTAEKVTLMTRVNQLYNDDLAIKMILVDGTDRLNFDTVAKATGPNGPCGAHPCYTQDEESTDYVEGQISYCDVGTLVRNQTVLGQLIGASNYDIGHIALGTNGGGIAGLGVVGGIEKAQGCTGIPEPVGDYYAIDYVAHEMGHQFGGNHTFNGNQWNCAGGNRNPGTSVEPGSGSSIMAYAGICRQDNLQPHSDPYFSQRSITEITSYTGTAGAPAVEVQDVSLSGFGGSDSIRIGYPGSAQTFTLTPGSSGATAYNAANIEAAVEALTGEDVTVAGWGYDPYAGYVFPPNDPNYPATLTAPDETGFQVMFAGDPDVYTEDSDRRDMAALIVTANGATAHVGETAKGGASDSEGFDQVTTDNHSPVVSAPANKTIPMRTPFTLTGKGTDADGDDLVYLWEQNDDAGGHDGTALVSNQKKWGPLFRVFGTYADVSDEDAAQSPAPGENMASAGTRSRTFPDLAQVLAGNTNARSGRCPKAPANDPEEYVVVPIPIVDCYSEFLPTKGYAKRSGAMHFRLTARDTVEEGGGVSHDDVRLRVSQHAGPFLVSSFAKGGSVKGGSRKAITWQVNGTRSLAKSVRIVLSTDNGRTWSTVLKTKTANDGKASVRLPKVETGKAWLMVKAVDNYFFDVSDHTFRIK
jgi:hypothetical protein